MLYDGEATYPRYNALISVEAGTIASIADGIDPKDLPTGTIRVPVATPGLIDLQINGAGDVQFNFDLSQSGLQTMVDASARGGAAYIFPTFTTAPGSDYREAVEVVRSAVANGVKGIAGIHLEGPFISDERPGIHRPEFIRPLNEDDVQYLCNAAKDITIILTIAPEKQDQDCLRRLNASGVILFAGHSNADIGDMKTAARSGVRGVTHLFNAMSQTTGRQPGVVGAVLGDGDFYAGIIADGYHVHPTNLSAAARAIPDRLCLVTDAMQTMNGNTTSFDLYGKRISLRDGMLTGEDGTLGGAHLSMDEAIQNMSGLTHVSIGEAIRMASKNPANAVGLGEQLGTLDEGKEAALSFFDNDLNCIGIVREGAHIAF
ncbi:N-acetylglucosamine-6-phosphate deacetylase [Aliiroseovarius sp. PrR006]|uniref:N-acetylglucosamine-6-phosphate deacetylase n=1 Tax=Aliiroseovarius sp. PrR006 TaxID=2706883 RepID=UPI0013D23E86|nr:N-acetylglucosamine-6-phosphate deacetylase [Aliiroseovarius sp. PrR006]